MGIGREEAVRLTGRTAKSFGFEWSRFSGIYAEYESNFLSYIAPLTSEYFKGKVVLDAGCGAGRHTYFAARWGAEWVIALDVSQKACDAAAANCDGLPVKVLCTDLATVGWFWPESFDYTFCIGVLHHLSDPREGFDQLVKTIKPGGAVSVWVYGRKDNRMALYLYEPVRKLTTRLPHRLLYWLALPAAVVVEACNRARLPLFSYYRRFPFRTKWNDAFDVLSAPSAKYYDLPEIREWFEGAGLTDVRIEYRMLNGKAKGIKGYGVKR